MDGGRVKVFADGGWEDIRFLRDGNNAGADD